MDIEKLEKLTGIFADPFEFLKYVKIQEPGDLALDYVLWPHLVDFYLALEKYQLIDLIKAKQIGISWALAVHVLRKIYTLPGWNVLEFSKGQTESQELLAKSKIIYNNLPDWMKIYTLEPNSTEKFGFKEMGSKILTYPSTESAGIGETGGTVIHDESDFHEYYKVNLGHTSATVADSSDRQLISVSTVDKTKPDSDFKTHWIESNNGYKDRVIEGVGHNGFKALFYGYAVRPNRGIEFYEQKVRENENTLWVVEGNYPRTIAEALSPQSAISCFKKERLDKLWENTLNVEPKQGFIYILSPPRVGVQYVAGGDVGEGVGLDYSCLTIIGKDGLNSEVAAIIYTNTLATDLFAYECDKLCHEYFDCLLGVENNAIGVAVLNKLVELNYPNLYYSDEKKQKAGWTTGEKNKHTGIVELVQAVNDSSLASRFKPQVKELMEFQWVNGKPVPTGKTHGDTVISLMIANQMLKYDGGIVEASMFIGGKRIF